MDISFDCYGTLLDTREIKNWFIVFGTTHEVDGQAAWQQFELWKERLMYGERIVPFSILLKQTLNYVDMVLQTQSLFSNHFNDLFKTYKDLKPWPEVILALRQLRESGNRVIIMSNSTSSLMSAHLDALGQQVDLTILPEQTQCYKPDLAFFNYASNQVIQPHLHVAMGYWWDIVPCHKIGWASVWINRRRLAPLTTIKPTYTLPNLKKLPRLASLYDS
ncbi:HAD family hydrolase [Lacticaseibacillus paracasei]|uniref:HAD family hydrolase n=1 Tax=Lacticaseibacillus paracasei TaxID=1597 RepID=UPI0002983DCC|nr:putative 2-haloacid dehalogenase [Lacticaseibacillus paracasei]